MPGPPLLQHGLLCLPAAGSYLLKAKSGRITQSGLVCFVSLPFIGPVSRDTEGTCRLFGKSLYSAAGHQSHHSLASWEAFQKAPRKGNRNLLWKTQCFGAERPYVQEERSHGANNPGRFKRDSGKLKKYHYSCDFLFNEGINEWACQNKGTPKMVPHVSTSV